MSLLKIILLLITYTVVIFAIDRSSSKGETFRTQIFNHIKRIFKRESSQGLKLIEQIQLLKSQSRLDFGLEFDEYKSFHLFIEELLAKMRSLGKVDLDSLEALLSILNCDVMNQRKLEELTYKGYLQLTAIQVLTGLFLYYVSLVLEVPLESWSYYILLFCFLVGVMTFYISSSLVSRKLLGGIESFIFVCLGIKSYSNLNLPIKKVTELANVPLLYQLNLERSAEARLFEWLENSLRHWRDQGVSIQNSLQQIIGQATAHRESQQRRLNGVMSFIMFLCLLFFGLVPFLGLIFQMISSFF